MKHVYVVYDKTDRNFYKPFMYICHTEVKAQEIVDDLRKDLPDYCTRLVYYKITELL